MRLVHRRHPARTEQTEAPGPPGLVAHVGFVERRVGGDPLAHRGSFVAGCGRRGAVGRVRREVGEERSGVFLDERDRLVREHGRGVVGRPASEAAERPAVDHLVAVVGGGVEHEPPVPPGRDVVRRRTPVQVQVLAEDPGAVARRVERRRERGAVVERGESAMGRTVPPDVVRVGVRPGEDARAARAAERIGHDGVGECHPARTEKVSHVRHRPQGVVALVVGHDQHDVRGRCRGGRCPGRSVLADAWEFSVAARAENPVRATIAMTRIGGVRRM